MWTDEQLRLMINERKNDNAHYHTLHEGRRKIWWVELASKINLRFGVNYTRNHVKEKFQGIVRDVYVSKIFI